ncbi:hypothetical protein AHiyo4_04480 [Arthrobacter sp. Hiyo4]|nr:hypothetical protein AHiyo4_04480 [Arthrobacter sp. Hiyo4]
MDAARLKQEAEQKADSARSLQEDIAEGTQKANALDPDINQDGDARADATRTDATRAEELRRDRDRATGLRGPAALNLALFPQPGPVPAAGTAPFRTADAGRSIMVDP